MMRRTMLSTVAMMAFGFVLLSLAATAQNAQTPPPPRPQQQAQPPKPPKELIIGTWSLLLADTDAADGTRMPNYGPNPKGTVMFGADGRYSLQIIRDVRPKFAANDRLKGTPDENKAAVAGTLSHFGRYTLDDVGKTLTLRIEGSSFPNWDATSQVRPVTALTDEVLTWVTPVASGGGGKAEVVWRKAK